MSYKTYITEALVCGVFDNLTSDRSYLLFTREAGMLYASAKSVREERSKHRYALQEFSRARVSLVRGKSGWRIIGTEPIGNFYITAQTREERAFYRKILILLKRVVQGESPHAVLFDDVCAGFCIAKEGNGLSLSALLTLRILYMLGYIARDERTATFFDTPLTKSLIETLTNDDCVHIEALTDRALLESHL